MKDYIQSDPEWGSKAYAGENMALAGCGATAVADVTEELPPDVADYITSIGGASNGSGTYRFAIKSACDHYGRPCVQMNESSLEGQSGTRTEQEWLRLMKTGKYEGILLMGYGFFANAGHYIAVRSVDQNNNVSVYDVAYGPRSGTWPFYGTVPAGQAGACNTGCPFFAGAVKVFYLIEKVGSEKKEEDPTMHNYPFKTITEGEVSVYAFNLQVHLKARGFYDGDLDQSAGPQTFKAWRAYVKKRKSQGVIGLRTNVIGKAEWTDLMGISI